MITFSLNDSQFVGEAGSLAVLPDDEIAYKLAMLLSGECQAAGPLVAAAQFGYTKQRYYQIRTLFLEGGAQALQSQPRGPKTQYRRTPEVTRQVIRYCFLDPQTSPEVIAQKLRQNHYVISQRSVERIVTDFGLQKKTLHPGP